MKKRTRFQKIFLLLVISVIGYAILTTQLKIDGTYNVSRTKWDIHFENVQVKSGSVEANPVPITNNVDTTEMSYAIHFTQPGDYYEFNVDIVNGGTIDAMIDSIENNAYSADGNTKIEMPTYLKSTIYYSDGGAIIKDQLLEADYRENIKVRVEFRKDIDPADLPSDNDVTIVFKLKANYVQAAGNTIRGHLLCHGENCVYTFEDIDKQIKPNDQSNDYNTLDEYTYDYTELLKKGTKRNIFAGYILDENGKIRQMYTCGIYDNNELFCIEHANTYSKITNDILNSNHLWNGKCTVGDGYINCDGNISVRADNMHVSIYDNYSECSSYYGALGCNDKS